MPVYAVTIFLSAFLLFQVQPMIAKMILPWFGGSAAVWSAALLFFQLLLLFGYLYAHCSVRYLKPKQQMALHIVLLVASLGLLPVAPSPAWKPTGAGDPTLRILALLGATIGLPYLLLSATSPLLQAWNVRRNAQVMPYRLFALSNLGSMLALLSYPALVEPWLASGTQAMVWSVGYAAFAALCAMAGWGSRRGEAGAADLPDGLARNPSRPQMLLWVGLAACPSTLLLAVTSHLTQNVAPIPLLWVLPLSLYLLSFILCFESDRIYQRRIFLPLVAVALGVMAYAAYAYLGNLHIKMLIPLLAGGLFVCAMVCHGEVARSKPDPRHLTPFYLMVSAGGAVGGLFVALVAPRLFRTYLELPLVLIVLPALLTLLLWREVHAPWKRVGLVALPLALGGYLGYKQVATDRRYLLSARNFYGVLKVYDVAETEETTAERVLIHGTINHGTELLRPGAERIPTSYFGPGSGIARALRALQSAPSIKIGILGLGAGVTATLVRPGDAVRYYEINPLVVDIANTWFTFLKGCPAEKEVYLGDGRLVLERQASQQFDLLAMDAFTSDAVPVHLITRQACATYFRHLKPHGVLAINISNRYLDLEPVVAQAAAEFGRKAVVVYDSGEDEDYYKSSSWALIATDPAFFERAQFKHESVHQAELRPNFRAWTDDYSNLIQILK